MITIQPDPLVDMGSQQTTPIASLTCGIPTTGISTLTMLSDMSLIIQPLVSSNVQITDSGLDVIVTDSTVIDLTTTVGTAVVVH